jgi:hypothetical protein
MITSERWSKFSYSQQMGHIGSEISRARVWQDGKDTVSCNRCIERAFDLIDLTKADKRWQGRLKEICRLREALADQYGQTHIYQISLHDLERYCMDFAIVSRRNC